MNIKIEVKLNPMRVSSNSRQLMDSSRITRSRRNTNNSTIVEMSETNTSYHNKKAK